MGRDCAAERRDDIGPLGGADGPWRPDPGQRGSMQGMRDRCGSWREARSAVVAPRDAAWRFSWRRGAAPTAWPARTARVLAAQPAGPERLLAARTGPPTRALLAMRALDQ
jgi:hypothetical protein